MHDIFRQSLGMRLCFFVPAFQPVYASKYAKIKNTFLYICAFQKKVVILQRKMNRAPVAKKVLRYLAHAEGICLSGG
jgi:hypothetical protein